MKFNPASFPVGGFFTNLENTSTLAYFNAGATKLLVKKVANLDQAVLCGGVLVFNTVSNEWFYAAGYLARKLRDLQLLPCTARLFIHTVAFDPQLQGLKNGYRLRPHYHFAPTTDGDQWLCLGVITQNYVGFGMSGTISGDGTRLALRPDAPSGWQVAMDYLKPEIPSSTGTKVNTGNMVQLCPVMGHPAQDKWRMPGHVYSNTVVGSQQWADFKLTPEATSLTSAKLTYPNSIFELGLIQWPYTLKRTWYEGKANMLAQITGKAEKYAPYAWPITYGKLPEETLPFALVRAQWGNNVYRGRDPRTSADVERLGGLLGRVYGTSGYTGAAPDSSGSLGLDDVKYEIVTAKNLTGNDVYMGYQATSNIDVAVPCIHQMGFRWWATGDWTRPSDSSVSYWEYNPIVFLRSMATTAAIGRFMGAEAGAVLRHLWPADYHTDSGVPRTVIGNEITMTEAIDQSVETVNIELKAATDWPGLSTDPTQRALQLQENATAFANVYHGPVKRKEPLATERWCKTIITGLGEAVDIFCDDIEAVARQMK